MDYLTLIPESKEGQEQSAKQMQSLYEVCQQVVDGREARGKVVLQKNLNSSGTSIF
jgi:hypothetical protein